MIEPLKIFCCYAQEDKSYFKKLKNHLTSLAMQKHITIRSTANINPGDEAQKAFQQELSTANIILLLISPDFMGSNYPEMQAALTYHEQGKARVIPILIRPTYWKDTPIARLQKLPNNDKPVADLSHWHSEDHALFNIAEQMNPIVIDLRVQQLEREIQTLDDLDNLLENYARPIALYQQIIKLKPDHAMAHNNIGDIYFSQHQYEKALHAYEEAQKLDTPFAYGYKKAEALLHLERYPESLEANRLAQLDALIGNNNPQLPDLYQQQANIYLVLNDLDNALKAYQNLLQLQPDNAHYCYKTGSLLSKLHIYDQAQAMFMNAIELQPENPDYHIALAETYYKLGKHADALASYQQLMQMINIDPSQRFRVGQLQLILQQYTQAIDSFNGSFQYGQTGAYVYYYQSQALQKLGRYEEALDYANKAIAFNMPPPDPQFLEHKRLLFELLAQETQKQAQIARLAWVKQEKFSFVPESVTLLKEFVAHTSDVNCLAITPDGCRLFSGSSNGEIKEWRPGAEEPLPEIGGHSDAITNLSISADGKTMISNSQSSIKICDLRTMQWEIIASHPMGYYNATISHDGTTVARYDRYYDSITLWNKTQKLYSSINITSPPIAEIQFSLDDQNLHISQSDGVLKKIAIATKEVIFSNPPSNKLIARLILSPDGKILLSSYVFGHKICLWNEATGDLVNTLDAHTNFVNSIAVHPDGQLLASSGTDKTIKYWHLKTGELLHTIDSLGNALSIVFNPTNTVLYAGYKGGMIRAWSML